MNEYKQITEWEVLTPSGWSDFGGIKTIEKDEHLLIKYTDGEIGCSSNHKLKTCDGNFIYAEDINVGDELRTGQIITEKISVNGNVKLYDLIDVEANNEYFTNEIVSHNCAFISAADKIWTSAQSTLSTGGSAIILSTPNGASGLFYQLWMNAIEGKAPEGLERFNPIKLKWDLHPERDQVWRDQQDELAGSKRAAAQENDVSFEASGHTVVNPEDIQYYEQTTIKPPIEVRGANQEYWLWAYPRPGKTYIVAVDVGRGDSADYSAIQVIDVEEKEQVAEWKGKIGTNELAQIAVSIATEWNMALLAIENSNVGWATVQEAINLDYLNLYYTFRQDPYIDPNIHIAKNYDLKNKEDMVPGHTTSPKSRPTMIGKLQTSTCKSSRYLTYHSERLQSEVKAFKWINGKAQADAGYSDDLIMALCIALYVIDTAMKLKSLGVELTKLALTNIKKVVYKPNKNVGPQYQMKVNGKMESIAWLL